MSKLTPRLLAISQGFMPLGDGSYFKAEPSLFDRSPVGLILEIHRGRVPGQYQFSITTDGGASVVRSIGAAAEIERATVVLLVLHERHELRKEAVG